LRFLIWQAAQGSDIKKRDELRTRARELLNELKSRRADSTSIPLYVAELEEQELRQGGLTEEQTKAKEETIANCYVQAIKLGQRNSALMRRTLELLFKNSRDREAIELLNILPAESQLGGNLKRLAEQFAIEKKDFRQ